jgi:hypothetical protein
MKEQSTMENVTSKKVKFKNLLDVQNRFPDEKSCIEYLNLSEERLRKFVIPLPR